MIDAYCESCGKQFAAKRVSDRQCDTHARIGAPVVQDVVQQIKDKSDQHIYDLKVESTVKLRSLNFKNEDERHALWRTVKACDRELVRRELPSLQPDTLERIKRITEKRFVQK